MSTTSLWLKEPHDGLPRSRSEGRAEVVVIGGGVTGCSCALTLAERGVRVRLYEAGHGDALALACGDLVARAILGEHAPELGIFDPARAALRRGV